MGAKVIKRAEKHESAISQKATFTLERWMTALQSHNTVPILSNKRSLNPKTCISCTIVVVHPSMRRAKVPRVIASGRRQWQRTGPFSPERLSWTMWRSARFRQLWQRFEHKRAVFQVFSSREDPAPRTKSGGGGCAALGRNAKSTDNGHSYYSLIITPPSEVTKLLRELWELWMEVTAANSNKNRDTKGGKRAKMSRRKQY